MLEQQEQELVNLLILVLDELHSVSLHFCLNFNTTEMVHTVKVTCSDKVGNVSENVIKFPPIIEFSPSNVTLSKDVMNGTFTVYSPSSFKIKNIHVVNPADTGVTKIICNGQDL